MIKQLAAITLIAGVTLAASSGMAQIAPSSNAPVDLTADEVEVRQGECLAVWRGRAEALQERSRLRANTINVFSRKSGGGGTSCGDLDRLEAIGDVFYVTPKQRVRGDRATYAAASNTITVTGDVIIDQEGNIIRARRLVINVDSGQATMDGQGGSGRVRGVFTPNQTAPTKQP